MAIYNEHGQDISMRSEPISESARESYRRAIETSNAKPSGNPGRNLRAEGNVVDTQISDPMAIREAMKYDQ